MQDMSNQGRHHCVESHKLGYLLLLNKDLHLDPTADGETDNRGLLVEFLLISKRCDGPGCSAMLIHLKQEMSSLR